MRRQEDNDDLFYAEVLRLGKENKLPKYQLICPNCGDLLDCKNRSVLISCSCKCLRIDSNGTDEIERIIYKAPIN